MKVQGPLPAALLADTSAVDTRDPKLLAASRMYEKQFLREMVSQMRKTVMDSGLIEVGMGEKIFREKLDDQYVEIWGDRGGIGLADLIYNQVLEKYGANMSHGPTPEQLHKGAFPIHPGTVQRILQKKDGAILQMKIVPKQVPTALNTPWSGRILAKGTLDDGRSFIKIGHDNGLMTDFVYRGGSINKDIVGSHIAENQTIGLLGAELNWNLQAT